MKYLKMFESFDFGEYYEITADQYDHPEGKLSHMTEKNYSDILLYKPGELRPGNRNRRVYKADQIEGLVKFIDEVL